MGWELVVKVYSRSRSCKQILCLANRIDFLFMLFKCLHHKYELLNYKKPKIVKQTIESCFIYFWERINRNNGQFTWFIILFLFFLEASETFRNLQEPPETFRDLVTHLSFRQCDWTWKQTNIGSKLNHTDGN